MTVIQSWQIKCNGCGFITQLHTDLNNLTRLCKKVGWEIDKPTFIAWCPYCVNSVIRPEDRKPIYVDGVNKV